MVLNVDVLEQYFAKSERMNVLQARIKSYVTLLKRSYDNKKWNELRNLTPRERSNTVPFDSRKERRKSIALENATLMFRWDTDDSDPMLPVICWFSLVSRDVDYDLTEQQIPSQLIEPVYELLPQLTELMGLADETLPSEIQGKIQKYLL